MRRSRWNASISRKTLRKPPGGSASLTRCGKYRSFLRPAISRLRRVIWSNSPPLRASPPHKPGSSSSTNRASARAVRRVFDYPLVRRKAEPSVNVILFPAMRGHGGFWASSGRRARTGTHTVMAHSRAAAGAERAVPPPGRGVDAQAASNAEQVESQFSRLGAWTARH